MPDTLLVIVGCIAVELFVMGAVVFAIKPGSAVVAILSSFLVDTFTVKPVALEMGLNLYTADAVFVPMSVAALIRLLALRRLNILHLILGSLWLLFALSFVRGVDIWGPNLAGVEARGSFYFFTAVLYFSTVPPTRRFVDHVINTWMFVAAVVAMLALFRWLAQIAGWGIASRWQDDFFAEETVKGLRVLDAPQTFVLAIAMFISLMKILSWPASGWRRWFTLVLALEIFLLQHRTVWMVSIIGIVWLLVMDGRVRGKLTVLLGALAITASGLILVFMDSQPNTIVMSLQTSATSEGTFQWRLEGWKQLLANDGRYSVADRLFGQPFGAGFPRIINGFLVDRSPHNFYVQVLIRMGIIGLLLLVALYVIAFRGLGVRQVEDHQGLWSYSKFWQMLLIMHLFYFITYAPIYEQGIIIGMTTGLVIVSTIRQDRPSVLNRRQPWLTSA